MFQFSVLTKEEGQARQSTMLYGGGSTRFPGGNTNNRVAAAPVSKILNSARFGRGSFHIIIILIILLTMIPFIMSPTCVVVTKAGDCVI